jgi:hypothetical protein
MRLVSFLRSSSYAMVLVPPLAALEWEGYHYRPCLAMVLCACAAKLRLIWACEEFVLIWTTCPRPYRSPGLLASITSYWHPVLTSPLERVNALSRDPNAGSICDHSTGSDTDPHRSRTPNALDVDNNGSYGISTDASRRRHLYRMSNGRNDGHIHRSVHKCARRRLREKGSQKPRIQRQRSARLL